MESEGKWVKGGEGRREKGEGLGKSEGMWKEERKRWNESVKENGFCFFVFVSLLHFSPRQNEGGVMSFPLFEIERERREKEM